MSYKEKYLKYKTKYSLLKEQIGGSFIKGDYDDDSPTALFKYTSSISDMEFFHSYAECMQDLYINFYENNSPYMLDNFNYYGFFLYIMLKIRIYLWFWEDRNDAVNTFLRNTNGFITYPELAPAIEQIIPYSTSGGYNGNDKFITDPFIAVIELLIYKNLLEKRDTFRNNISKSITISQKMSDELRNDDEFLKNKLIKIKIEQKSLPTDDRRFNQYLNEQIDKIAFQLHVNKNGAFSPFNRDVIQEYKKYYKDKQNIERLETEIKKLHSKLAAVAAKIRVNEIGYLNQDLDITTLHERFQIEFSKLDELLHFERVI
jgi:hypothetical protein